MMNYYDYRESIEIAKLDFSFYALIMAAMRQADTDNLNGLKAIFPAVYDQLQARYHAPGGLLDEDPDELKQAVIEGRA